MGEIVGEFIVHIVLNYIGGTIRWLFGVVWCTIFNKPKHTFKEYIYGPDEFDHYDSAHGCINVIIGLGFIALIVYIVSKI